MRNSILRFFWFDIANAAGLCLIGESLALYYNYIIRDLINYIKSDEDETTEGLLKGLKLIGMFIGLMLITTIFRNQYIIGGF